VACHDSNIVQAAPGLNMNALVLVPKRQLRRMGTTAFIFYWTTN
jgi:hypothetical protein